MMSPTRARTILSRLLEFLGTLALALLALLFGLYFSINSRPGHAHLLELMSQQGPEGLKAEVLHWGPHPGTLTLGGIELSARGKSLARLEAARLELSLSGLGSLLDGSSISVHSVTASFSHIHATIDAEGSVDLVAALKPPSPPVAKPPGPRRRFTVDSFDLRCGHMTVLSPQGSADLSEISFGGRLDINILPRLTARLRSGAAYVEIPGKAQLTVDTLSFDNIEFTGTKIGFDLSLERGSVPLLDTGVRADLSTGRVDFGLSADLRPLGPHVPLGLPQGLFIEDSRLSWSDGRLAGSVARLGLSAIETSICTASDISLAIPDFAFKPGSLLPKFEMSIDHLSADTLEIGPHTFSGLLLGGGRVIFDKRLDAHFGPGHSASWVVNASSLGAVSMSISTDLGLSGGLAHARLETSFGLVDLTGSIKTSLLKKRIDYKLFLSFEHPDGPLLPALLPSLPPPTVLSPAPMTSASAELRLSPPAPPEKPGLSHDWVEASIEQADGIVHRWSDGAWLVPQSQASLPVEIAP